MSWILIRLFSSHVIFLYTSLHTFLHICKSTVGLSPRANNIIANVCFTVNAVYDKKELELKHQ